MLPVLVGSPIIGKYCADTIVVSTTAVTPGRAGAGT
jgi:hypothetical protein